ncbi:MAG: hypothetical protein ABI867_21645 [Kofleriaceae bacterium]
MRLLLTTIFLAAFAGCGANDGGAALSLATPDRTLAPGEESTYCYYDHTDNTSPVLINRWVSEKPQGIHHAIMFTNPSGDQPPDGSFDPNDCGIVGLSQPLWTYATVEQQEELLLPPDDGDGKPVVQLVAPHTAVYFSIHYINATDLPITVHFSLDAFKIDDDAPHTETAPLLTYNNSIAIPPNATNHVESASCPLPEGVKFWHASIHSHKQTVHDSIKDGDTVVFETSDWEHPGQTTWDAPFYTFQSPNLTWECVYDNLGSNKDSTVTAGPTATVNEMCMGRMFMVPATKVYFCVWDTSIPGNCVCD